MGSISSRLVDFFLRMRGGAIEVSNRRYEKIAKTIVGHAKNFSHLSDAQLKTECTELKQRIRNEGVNHSIDSFYAIVREAAARTLELKMFEVQLVAGVALAQGLLVEMQTGEGKTLAAVAPACLHAIANRGTHVLTFNDYLAERDAQWMRPVYEFMGFSVDYVSQDMSPDRRRKAYAADVTYLTAKSLGFDFLRDQLCTSVEDQVQREFHFAILDEADSTLVDEARIPLVIAGEDQQDIEHDLHHLASLVRKLNPNIHYSIQPGMKNASFNSSGLDLLQELIGCDDLFADSNVTLLTRLNLALQAETLLTIDVDYIVRDERVELIDEFTGRVADNRRWPYGLQAAIEAKEHLEIQPQGRILKSITLQHLFEHYKKFSGMTGTARPSAIEINEFYDLRTVIVPPNRPCKRVDQNDIVFVNKDDKHRAIAHEIKEHHKTGRPILVGTSSVEESEALAQILTESQIECRVLNAKNDPAEAEIIAEAGKLMAVTISTNMAGRGTDISLGGRRSIDREKIVQLGGLYVIGTNRHESRRIDDQLRGRAGRQGDPGESRFFVSGQDDLLFRCEIEQLDSSIADTARGTPVTDPILGKRISRIQRFVESESLEIRRTLRMYSKCLEIHRVLAHQLRQQFLDDTSQHSMIDDNDPDLYQQILARYGTSAVREAECRIAIFHIDDCWADHLQACSEIRNSIHLTTIGGFNAFDQFNRRVNELFRTFNQRVIQKVIESFRAANRDDYDLEVIQSTLTRPASTWTYMINDSPTGDVSDRLARGIKKLWKK